MTVSGSFTTASALSPNLSLQNVVAQVTDFSFSDGINTYAFADSNSRMYLFAVTTNGSGQITAYEILIELWTSGTSPHSSGDRFSYMFITNGNTLAFNNSRCVGVGPGNSGVADSCDSENPDSSRSAASGPAGTWTSSSPVPTLGEWGMILLAGLLILYGRSRIRRQDGVAQAA